MGLNPTIENIAHNSQMSDWYVLGEDCRSVVRLSFEEYLETRPSSARERQDDSIRPGDSWAKVAHTVLPDGSWVSTVFLGLDHSWEGPPMIFESMVFDGEEKISEEINIPNGPKLKSFKYHEELGMQRYSTWDEAEAGHKAMVEERLAELEFQEANKVFERGK